MAVAIDVGAVVLFALVLALIQHAFWAPLALATVAYYGTGVLAAGNTPGFVLMSSRVWRNWPALRGAWRPRGREHRVSN
jgi:hypothetical protein